MTDSDKIMKLGVGVMIRMLGGNEDSVNAFVPCVNKTINNLVIEDDKLRFTFDDGTRLDLVDNGQSCCESRYMQTDDDLGYFVGSRLLGAEVKEAPNVEDEYGDHEVAFLVVTTSKGSFSVANHNEHNGYYGGFYINAEVPE